MPVTRPYLCSFQPVVRNGVVLLLCLAAIAGCTPNGPLAPQTSPSAKRQTPSPSPSPTPSPIESPTPSPSPSPSVQPSPVVVPAWAAMHGSCVTGPAAQEAVPQLQGTANPRLPAVSNANAP